MKLGSFDVDFAIYGDLKNSLFLDKDLVFKRNSPHSKVDIMKAEISNLCRPMITCISMEQLEYKRLNNKIGK
jgi:hypothetical protein